jgi:hypothetical protein
VAPVTFDYRGFHDATWQSCEHRFSLSTNICVICGITEEAARDMAPAPDPGHLVTFPRPEGWVSGDDVAWLDDPVRDEAPAQPKPDGGTT